MDDGPGVQDALRVHLEPLHISAAALAPRPRGQELLTTLLTLIPHQLALLQELDELA